MGNNGSNERWWKLVDRHIENLIPGVATLVPLLALACTRVGILRVSFEEPLVKLVEQLVEQEAYAGPIAFLATAYLLGVLSFTLGRLFLDTACQFTFQPLLFKSKLVDEGGRINRVSGETWWRHVERVGNSYHEALRSVIKAGNIIVIQEIEKRRQRGRLIRGALVPAALILFVVASASLSNWLCLLMVVPLYVAFLVIFAFAELSVYQEALLGIQEGEGRGQEEENRVRWRETGLIVISTKETS